MEDEGQQGRREPSREMGQKGGLAPGEGKHAWGAGSIQNGPRMATLASDPRDTRVWRV